jgi:hypothetical protein
MRIGGSLFLIAIGAILRFAITPQHSHGVNWGTIGVILMIVGAVGALITGALLTVRRRTDVTYRGAVPAAEPVVDSGRAGYVAPVPVDPQYGPPGYSSATYIEPAPRDPRGI